MWAVTDDRKQWIALKTLGCLDNRTHSGGMTGLSRKLGTGPTPGYTSVTSAFGRDTPAAGYRPIDREVETFVMIFSSDGTTPCAPCVEGKRVFLIINLNNYVADLHLFGPLTSELSPCNFGKTPSTQARAP